MYAVIATGGKQYLVREGQKLKVEKLEEEVGAVVSLIPMLIADAEGTKVQVGMPLVNGASVEVKIVEHGNGKKISVIKFKRKARYRRNVGHRQPFTTIEVVKIA